MTGMPLAVFNEGICPFKPSFGAIPTDCTLEIEEASTRMKLGKATDTDAAELLKVQSWGATLPPSESSNYVTKKGRTASD